LVLEVAELPAPHILQQKILSASRALHTKKAFYRWLYHLAGQIVLDDGFRLVLLELALDVRGRENSVAVDVDQVNVGFGVAQQR